MSTGMDDGREMAPPVDADELLLAYGDGAVSWAGEEVAGVDGLRVLADVVAEIEGMGDDRAKRAKPLVALYRDAGRFGAVVDAYDRDPAGAEAHIVRLDAVKGMAKHADKLRQRMGEAVAERRRAGLRVVGEGEVVEVRAAVRDETYPAGIVVPEGWLLTRGQLTVLKHSPDGRRMAIPVGPPVLIRRFLVDLDTKDWHVELSWPDGPKGWHNEVVPRDTALDSRGIVRLARRGLPVSSTTSRTLVQWLTALDQQRALPRSSSTARLGWLGTQHTHFMLGETLVAPEKTKHQVRFVASEGAQQYAQAFHCKGTWDGWLQTVALVKRHPSAYVAIYLAAAAPLLQLVGADNFGVDWAGRSGTGKTTSLTLGASFSGSPDRGGVMRAWGGTVAGADSLSATASDVALILNEGQLVPPKDRERAGVMLYQLCEGLSQAKGDIGRMGQRRVERFHTVVMSASEEGITSWSPQEGVRRRILVLRGSPLGDRQADLANAIRDGVHEHYGHAAVRLIKHLVSLDLERRDLLRALYVAERDRLRKTAESHLAQSAAEYVAVVTCAAEVLHRSLGVPKPEVDVLGWFWTQAQLACGDGDRGLAALDRTWGWCNAHRHEFRGERTEAEGKPSGGWAGVWKESLPYLAIDKAKLEQLLRDARYAEPESVLRLWRERGWLQVRVVDGTARSLDWQVRVKQGDRTKVGHYCILWDAFDALEPDQRATATAQGIAFPEPVGEGEGQSVEGR